MDFKSVRENIISISAIIGLVTFAASLVYNYCFFLNLGMSFSQIPISISDITQTFLYWLPYSLSILISSFLFLWFAIPSLFTGKPIPNKDLSSFLASGNFLTKSLFIIVVVVFATYVLFGNGMKRDLIYAIAISLILITGLISDKITNFLLKSSVIQKNDIIKIILVFYYSMFSFIFIGYMGYKDSQGTWDINPPSAIIFMSSRQIIKSNIIRTLDKGVIIGTKDSSPDFIPWSSISIIRAVVSHSEFKGILCEYFGKCWLYPSITPKR